MSNEKSIQMMAGARDYETWNKKFHDVLVQISQIQAELNGRIYIADNHAREVSEQKVINQQLASSVEQREKQLSALDAERLRLTSLLAESRKQTESQKQLGSEISARLNEKQQWVAELEKKLENQMAASRKLMAENEELKIQHDRIRFELEARYQSHVHSVRDQLKAEYVRQSQGMVEQIKHARALIAQQQSERSSIDRLNAENTKKIQSLSGDLVRANATMERLRVEANRKLAAMSIAATNGERKTKALEAHLGDAQARIAQLEKSLMQKQSEIESLRGLNRSLGERVFGHVEATVDDVAAPAIPIEGVYTGPVSTADQ